MLRDGPRALARARRRRRRSRPTTARSRPAARSRAPRSPATPTAGPAEPVKVSDRVLAGFGWQRDDVKLVQQMASNGAEPIGSLGYDGPLAALSPERQNLADYFKETVAVVTNPAIDREREIEHFSTRAVFGRRPSIDDPGEDTGTVETAFPVILGGHHDMAPLSDSDLPRDRPRARDLPARGPLGGVPRPRRRRSTSRCSSRRRPRARSSGSSRRRSRRSATAPSCWCSPTAPSTTASAATSTRTSAISAVDQALKQFKVEPGEENLRRRCSIVLRSAAIRNVHDVMLAPRARRQRRLPLRDGRGDLRRRLRDRRLQPLRGAAQGDREGDLDDRDPRGARLRAPVLLDRGQARAGRDLPDRGLRRLRQGRRRLRRARRRHRRARSRSSPATRRRSRRRPSASTRRSTRPRSRPPTAPASYAEYSREGARPRGARARSRCATSWA